MYRSICVIVAAITFEIVIGNESQASVDTIGPNGINSIGLGLDGSGMAIGQVEPSRPGKFNFDNDAGCCNDQIVPTDVFVFRKIWTR